MAEEKTYKFPKTLGGCVDRLYALKAKKAERSRALKEVESEFNALKQHLIDTLPKSKLDGASGKTAKVEMTEKSYPTATDWEKFYAYVRRKGAFHLLQKRLNQTAFNELWADKKTVPGTQPFIKKDLSLTKKR